MLAGSGTGLHWTTWPRIAPAGKVGVCTLTYALFVNRSLRICAGVSPPPPVIVPVKPKSDIVPEPDANDPDLKRFTTDKEGLKRDLFARIQARGERATPALIEKALAGLERAYAAKSAIDAVRNAGGTAHYFSVNLLDGDAVAKVVNQIRERSKRIDVLVPVGTFNDARRVTLWAGVPVPSFPTLTVTRQRLGAGAASSGQRVLGGTIRPLR